MSRYLSQCYTFALELNLPSGRADLVLTGIPGTEFHNDCRVVEVKYFKAGEASAVESLQAPRVEDVAQVNGYARDINVQFPNYRMRSYVMYIAANKACTATHHNSLLSRNNLMLDTIRRRHAHRISFYWFYVNGVSPVIQISKQTPQYISSLCTE